MHRRRTVLTLALVAVLALATPVPAQEDPFPDDTVFVDASGSAAPLIDVALNLSRATFGDGGTDTVLIGRDDVFADSLASGVAQSRGPLLLVPRDGPVPDDVLAEIARVGATAAWVLGGEAAIGPAVVAQLEGAGLAVERFAGPSRVETAVAVARGVVPTATTALIAREGGTPDNPTSGFADALAGGGWAAAAGWPVLLTSTGALSASTAAYLEESVVRDVVILGGTAAVTEAVAQSLRDLGLGVERVAGGGRAETAIEIAKARGFETSEGAGAVVVVEGFEEDAWAAGFAAAALSARGPIDGTSGFAGAGTGGAPIVLGDGEALPVETQAWMVRGPDVVVCALLTEACERARLELGFPPSLVVGGRPPDPDLLPDTAWADEVVSYTPGTGFGDGALETHNPVRMLGRSDCVDAGLDPTCDLDQTEPRGYLSLGNGGSVELRFTDDPVVGDGDVETPELYVYEVGQRAEAVRLTLIPADGGAEVELFDMTGGGACGSDPDVTGEDAFTVAGDVSGVDADCWIARAGHDVNTVFDGVRITDVASEMPTTNRPTPGADLDAIATV